MGTGPAGRRRWAGGRRQALTARFLSDPGGRVPRMDAVHVALLPATAPFALGASLRALAGFMPGAADHLVTADAVRTALVRPGCPDEAVVVEVSPHLLDEVGVTLRVFAERPLTPEE